ncbi:cytochrome-c oxidase, cbb3-type subunit III [Zhengella mangrovi]|uniref:Cbb3-type cytochrome c oxidase subunit n=1 Tax=Zhengella mangrovi TaxID=1982044 RepID=A0A2G1QLW6_9HYPH|nr:cytochrome-c oxidase, cbb3-type subunit III [Zhengella mangrovi]PHP66464.1 cytochrome-c oxidase, cbb3-type subunit III [Zhengella mangrovi]
MSEKHIDEVSGVETTGHEWDGIRELNNPLPRWWLWTFYFTIIWAIGYTIVYPAWPGLTTNTKGLFNWSSRGAVATEMAAADAAKASLVEKIANTDLPGILADNEMRTFATAAGASTFKVYCSQCHGSGAQGGPGYPNLNDDDWLWGGDIDAIHTTIAHGIRYEQDDDTRVSEMPAFGEILEPEQIKQVAAYVASLSGTPSDEAAAKAGATVFAENCAACHGEDGRGMKEVGAPNLADSLWLYGSSEDAIAAQIRNPKHGVMPAWNARLGDTKVKELAVYVHSLGGGS